MSRAPQLLILAVVCFGVSSGLHAGASEADWIRRYQTEHSELAKRDLALKMIDAGVLKLGTTTRKDIVRIFGSDWHTFTDEPTDARPYGIVHFAKQPEAPKTGPPIQVPYVGWYFVVYFSPKTYIVTDWNFSNVHK